MASERSAEVVWEVPCNHWDQIKSVLLEANLTESRRHMRAEPLRIDALLSSLSRDTVVIRRFRCDVRTVL